MKLVAQELIRDSVINKDARREGKKRGLVLVLLNLSFGCTLVLAGPESGAFPFRLSSRVWRQEAGGTGYQFIRFLSYVALFWPLRKRVEGYEGETLFPQYVTQIILIIRNVISFE
jgi:hypothetical protein